MDGNSFRIGSVQIERALFNTRQASLFFSELLAIALLVGFAKHSWYWGGGTMAMLIVALAVKPLRILLVLSLCLVWAALAYFIGHEVFHEVPAGVVCSVAVFLLALFCHRAALEWIGDYRSVGRTDDSPHLAETYAPRESRQERECPHCAEAILVRANICKHCGRDVDPLDDPFAGGAAHARVAAPHARADFRSANATGIDSGSLLNSSGIAVVIGLVLLTGVVYWRMNDKAASSPTQAQSATIATRSVEAKVSAPNPQSAASPVVSESGPPPFPYAVYMGKVANSTMPNISATLTIYFNFVADSLSGRADIGPELAGGGVFSARTTTDSLFLISTSSAGDTIRWAAGRDADGHYSGTYTVTGGRSSGQGGIWEVEHSSGGDLQFVPRRND
jgi:hypothetical protein